MDYIQGLAEQTEIFLYALGFGFLLGIIYSVFRVLRMMLPDSKGFVFFMDLLYFAVCTFLAFCFILVADSGKIRGYVALGMILGWTVCYFSFGAISACIGKSVTMIFESAFSALFKPFKRFGVRIFRKIEKLTVFCKKNIRKTDKKEKIILQKYKDIVYNLLGYNKK